MTSPVLLHIVHDVLVTETFVGDDGVGIALVSGQALQGIGQLVGEEEPAVVHVVEHPSADGAGETGLILDHGDEGPGHVDGVHQEGESAPVDQTPLQTADLVVSPLPGGDAPAGAAIGGLTALENPVQHLGNVVGASLFRRAAV